MDAATLAHRKGNVEELLQYGWYLNSNSRLVANPQSGLRMRSKSPTNGVLNRADLGKHGIKTRTRRRSSA
jgi:hypothetical protein